MAFRAAHRRCPACTNTMLGLRVSYDDREVMLDVCHGCSAAFFDFADGTPARLARLIDPELRRPKPEPPAPARQRDADSSRDEVAPRDLDAIIDDLLDGDEAPKRPPARRELLCPGCTRPLSEHPKLARVFRCRGCWSVFAFSAGLAALARLRVR